MEIAGGNDTNDIIDRGMKSTNRFRDGGVYLVIDPSMPADVLLPRLKEAVQTGGICAVQLWDHWTDATDQDRIIREVAAICREAAVPVLVNNDQVLLKKHGLDGIHFDTLPAVSPRGIREEAGREVLVGITLGNDLGPLALPGAKDLDYLSFCSVFPSPSAGSCEIVSPETIRRARELTDLPVFLSGGISLSTLPLLEGLPFEGIAVISGVMGDSQAGEAAEAISRSLNQIKKRNKL